MRSGLRLRHRVNGVWVQQVKFAGAGRVQITGVRIFLQRARNRRQIFCPTCSTFPPPFSEHPKAIGDSRHHEQAISPAISVQRGKREVAGIVAKYVAVMLHGAADTLGQLLKILGKIWCNMMQHTAGENERIADFIRVSCVDDKEKGKSSLLQFARLT
jgi:hypothetical protein